jgi:uncharacterized membrane protein YkoI
MFTTKRKILGATVLALALGATATAFAGGRTTAAGGSRMDDGKDLLPQAKITETQAIQAAQTKASGELNEVDLEHLAGKLVFNVDVGGHDVKVDASAGDVVSVDADD